MTNEDRRRVVAEIGEALPMTARHLVSMFEELERENAELMEINQKLNDQIKVTNRNAAELVDKNAELKARIDLFRQVALVQRLEKLERENERLRNEAANFEERMRFFRVKAKDFATSVISVSSSDSCRAAMKFLEDNK